MLPPNPTVSKPPHHLTRVCRADPMSNRLSDAMNKLNVDSARNSLARPNTGANAKRHSGLDSSTINAMFPDAAAAIATEKAKFKEQTGNLPTSNRNSAAVDPRNSLVAPTISGPNEDANGGTSLLALGPHRPVSPEVLVGSSSHGPVCPAPPPPACGRLETSSRAAPTSRAPR